MSNITQLNQYPIKYDHPDRLTIGTWLLQVAPKTQKYYRRIAGELFLFLNDRPLGQMKTEELVLFLNVKCKSDSTKNVYRDVLGSLFSYAVKTGHLTKNPAVVISRSKVEERLYSKVLSREQIEQMIFKETSSRNKLILELIYMTGIRVDELTKLRVNSFREVKSAGDLKVTVLVEGKGKKFRTLNVPEATYEKLKHYWEEENIFPEEPCFISRKKSDGLTKPLSTVQVWRIVKAAARNANLSCAPSTHWLRHTSATHAIENGAPIHVVKASLGHNSINTTGKYLDIRPDKSIGAYLKPLK